MNLRRQPATVSREIVEDLNLRRFCIADQSSFPRDFFFIDRRRLKREMRKLPRLRAESRARFLSPWSNRASSTVDLTEESLEKLCEQIRGSAIRPPRWIVPPWVLQEIEEQYGAPATADKYHRWNQKRLGLASR